MHGFLHLATIIINFNKGRQHECFPFAMGKVLVTTIPDYAVVCSTVLNAFGFHVSPSCTRFYLTLSHHQFAVRYSYTFLDSFLFYVAHFIFSVSHSLSLSLSIYTKSYSSAHFYLLSTLCYELMITIPKLKKENRIVVISVWPSGGIFCL